MKERMDEPEVAEESHVPEAEVLAALHILKLRYDEAAAELLRSEVWVPISKFLATFWWLNEADIKELSSTIVRELLDRLETFKDFDHLRNYAYVAARNNALNEKRKRFATKNKSAFRGEAIPLNALPLRGEEIAAGKVIDEQAVLKVLKDCFDELPEEQRRVAYAYYYEDMTFSRCATLIDKSINTVRERIARAREMLQTCIENKLN